jgi:hypothetical protein
MYVSHAVVVNPLKKAEIIFFLNVFVLATFQPLPQINRKKINLVPSICHLILPFSLPTSVQFQPVHDKWTCATYVHMYIRVYIQRFSHLLTCSFVFYWLFCFCPIFSNGMTFNKEASRGLEFSHEIKVDILKIGLEHFLKLFWTSIDFWSLEKNRRFENDIVHMFITRMYSWIFYRVIVIKAKTFILCTYHVCT